MNIYKITEPAVISFSGGRTSAFMLYKILDAHDGQLPDYVKVCFANTGKEMPQTLDFVEKCSIEWNVPVVWLERYMILNNTGSKTKFSFETKIVNYELASRNGAPFESLFQRRYLPNPVARFCTQELKIEAMKDYMVSQGFNYFCNYVGFRFDEQRRVAKKTITKNFELICPLNDDQITKKDIFAFWETSLFDLKLNSDNGTTPEGNCDLCFLKGFKIKLGIVKKYPHLVDWWINAENNMKEVLGKPAYFRHDQPSYKQMKYIALHQEDAFGYDDETIPCFCGD